MNALSQAAQDVLDERQRQRVKWGDAHDDEHTNDSLAYGAVSYLLPGQKPMPADWAYKSKVVDRDPRREQLVKGAALALAAVEQYDRWNEAEERRADSEELCESCRNGDEHEHSPATGMVKEPSRNKQ